MSPKTRFVVFGLLIAALLYAALACLARFWPALWSLELATAVIAVMLAAQGVTWRRRILFASVTAVIALCLNEFAAVSGLGAAEVAGLTSSPNGPTGFQLAAVVVIQVFFVAVPVAALALYVGRRPSVLWTAPVGQHRGAHGPGREGKGKRR